jgi:hypothetical protein
MVGKDASMNSSNHRVKNDRWLHAKILRGKLVATFLGWHG